MTDFKKEIAPFRTVEWSTEKVCSGLIHSTVYSPALKGRADVTFYIPPQALELTDVPVVTLLHGVYGSHWAWSSKGEAHLGLQKLIDEGLVCPMILVMPSDGLFKEGSGYIPHHTGGNYEDWIVQDVLSLAQMLGGLVSPKSPQFITGLSMGGFGALRLGAKYSSQYHAFSGLSSITDLSELEKFTIDDDVPQEGASNVLEEILTHRGALSPFRFCCGKSDPLYLGNRALHDALLSAEVDHIYEEHPGGHEWAYWKTYILDTYLFFHSTLG